MVTGRSAEGIRERFATGSYQGGGANGRLHTPIRRFPGVGQQRRGPVKGIIAQLPLNRARFVIGARAGGEGFRQRHI